MPMINDDITVILADGLFPTHPVPLELLATAARVVCCDGATQKLLDSGLREPDYVVGDLDSLSPQLLERYADRLHRAATQETNDLTKAVELSVALGFRKLVILGATGLREDHTLGNISLLMRYAALASVSMYTDYGYFVPLAQAATLSSFAGQQVSVFSLTPSVPVSFTGLKWDIKDRPLLSWWEGTLNEALGDSFTVSFTDGQLLVYRAYA